MNELIKEGLNFEKYTTSGKEDFQNFTRDAEINKKRGLSEDTITDNLLVKGNNLLVLHSLVKEFRGKVKCIYIDPPYNTGNDSFNYNDKFNHSTWLCFMKNRLEIAQELLSDEGSIFISIDERMKSYLDILIRTNNLFNFFRELIWESGAPLRFKGTKNIWPHIHETIFHYCKNKSEIDYKPTYTFEKWSTGEPVLTGDIIKAKENKIYSMDFIVGAKQSVGFGTGQKPEELIKKLLEATTNEHDIVLDFFSGSGTTGAVAHKMNRQWIMVEQMDYIETITKERMKKVIEGEQGGISKSVNWQGGGEFVYFELKKDFINK